MSRYSLACSISRSRVVIGASDSRLRRRSCDSDTSARETSLSPPVSRIAIQFTLCSVLNRK